MKGYFPIFPNLKFLLNQVLALIQLLNLAFSSPFHWNIDPIVFSIPEFAIPVPVNIPGLLIGLFAYFILNANFDEKGLKLNNQKKAVPAYIIYKSWYLLALCLVLGTFLGFAFGASALAQFGPIEPRYYGLLFALAFVFGFIIGKKEFTDAGRSEEELEGILMYILGATVIGARLGHVFFYEPGYYLSNPLEIPMIWKGGLASHGAALAIIGTIWWITKSRKDMSFLWLADRVALPATLGGAFIRSGNFFNSEIVGMPTDSAFGVVFERLGPEALHPSQLYEALSYFVIFAFLWFIYSRANGKPKEGLILGFYLCLVFGARFFIEFTKSAQADFAMDWALSVGQLLSIPVVLAGLWVLKQASQKKTEAIEAQK
jgi:prolipoprotein diacylglyceryl transferase